MSLAVLIPAHNEEAQIADTLDSLLAQSVTADLIVVASDNSTDRTMEIAGQYAAKHKNIVAFRTEGNTARKSGALNQAWLRYGRGADFVLTMDADTTLTPGTIEKMLEAIKSKSTIGAVCARYWAKPGKGLVWRLQRIEYARYDDLRELRSWRVSVASGAAALYRGYALDGVVLSTRRATPWDSASLIEDYALTLDLKALGWQVYAAPGAHVLTDTPPTFRDLWTQRLRWGRGGMDEVRKRGWTPATRNDILAYGLFGVSSMMRLLWVALVVMMFVHEVPLRFGLIGVIPVAVVWVERMMSAWGLPGRTKKDVALVSTILVEDLYGFFLELCTVASAIKSLANRKQSWQ